MLLFYNCRCCVGWGDGSPEDCESSDKLENCQRIYQYREEDKTYTVTASYCNYIEENDFCCSSLTKPINISE